MKKSKFSQVVLPSILACAITVIVIRIITPYMYPSEEGEPDDSVAETNWFEEADEEKWDVMQNGNTYEDANFKDTEFAESAGWMNVGEAMAKTELTLDGIGNEEFGVRVSEGGVKKEERAPINLEDLSMFPRLKKLSIYPTELTDYYDDEEAPTGYYYSLDQQSLTLVPQLEELELKYMNIDNLDFLKNTNITRVTFIDCNFSELRKEEYKGFSKVKAITLEGKNTKLDMDLVMGNLTGLESIKLVGGTILEKEFISKLAHPEALKELSLTNASREPSQDKGFDIFSPLHKLTGLESLTIVGNISEFYTSNYYEDPLNINEVETLELDKKTYHEYGSLSYLKNLKHLKLEQLEITDLSFLSELTNLKTLSLAYNFVNDITPLQHLTKLEELDLSFNVIKDLSPIANAMGMKKLWVSNNLLHSVEPLKGMTSLEVLDLSSGFYYVNDPEYSAENVWSQFYEKEIGNYSGGYAPNIGYKPTTLEEAKLGMDMMYQKGREEEIFSPGFLGYQTFENDFMMGATDVRDYITLHPYESDSLWGKCKNRITDLRPLEKLSKLTFLDVSGNRIMDITPLKGMNQLQFLSCMDNQIEEIRSILIKTYPKLRYLYLSQNNIKEGQIIEATQFCISRTWAMQFCATPLYNKLVLGIVEQKKAPVHLEIMGMDVFGILINLGTGME